MTPGQPTPPTLSGLVYRDRLGAGGYSDVFLYEQQMPKMLVAVKVLHDDGLTDASRQRFTDEANAMASLSSHPYIVQIMAADVCADGRPYLVMQYYPRPNLSVRARQVPLSVPDVLRIGVQISSAVETAHRAGILHRDIKPANILTGQYGDPGLTDFGIAASTLEGHAQGPEGMSIPWSPPEVFDSDLAADARSDVYSLAATLFTLLTGRSPFEVTGGNNGALELMGRIARSDPPPLSRGDVPASLERLLRQAMSKNPARRPPTAVAFARSLQEVEQELQLKVTSIVIPDEAPEGRPGLDDGAGETRARMPVRIDAYAPVTSVPLSRPTPGVRPPPAPIELIDGTVQRGSLRPRVGMLPEPPVENTVLRPSTPRVEQVKAKTARRAGPVYAVVGVVLIGVVAVVAVLLSGGGTGTAKPQASGSPTTQVNDPLSGVAPPAPAGLVVKAGTTAGTVEVSWATAAPRAGDFFTVTRTDAGAVAAGLPALRATTTSATLTGVAAGVKPCVAVVLVRQNGTSSEATTGCLP